MAPTRNTHTQVRTHANAHTLTQARDAAEVRQVGVMTIVCSPVPPPSGMTRRLLCSVLLGNNTGILNDDDDDDNRRTPVNTAVFV